MDKQELIRKFVEAISSDLAVLTQAAMHAHEAATHAESKAEDQYDTRGLEASYLAGAQSKRAMELDEMRSLYQHIQVKTFGGESPIAATAVIELEDEDGKRTYYFMMPKGGGLSVLQDGKTVHIVTPQSPLGEAMMGKTLGDSIEVTVQKSARDYSIVGLW